MERFRNESIIFSEEEGKLYITVLTPGFTMDRISHLLLDFPTWHITDRDYLQRALEKASGTPILVGMVKPRVEIFLSEDLLQASIRLNITAQEFTENRIPVSKEIVTALHNADITEGLEAVFSKPLSVQSILPVAEGIPPIDGEDAKISYYEISERKPQIKADGSVNHYDLHLFDNVKKGDWLGEKVPPTMGIPGRSVTGKPLKAKNGKDAKLNYDPRTVVELQEGSKIVLRALIDGSVVFENGKIRIDNLLVIPGDVGTETGNVAFDGYVEINGTVCDGFSVVAKYDISVKGTMGIGAVDRIVSREGSIFIKGGVFGKQNTGHTTVIEAAKNVFVKYCNTCTIKAGDEINIGFYALDSELTAQRITCDPIHGSIIGGSITAETQVVAGTIGNKMEKKTLINVQGFDRAAIKAEFDSLLQQYQLLISQAKNTKDQLQLLERMVSRSPEANEINYKAILAKYEELAAEIEKLDIRKLKLQHILETKGEGEIDIIKAAYPETYLEIKKKQKHISSIVSGTFYAEDEELHHND